MATILYDLNAFREPETEKHMDADLSHTNPNEGHTVNCLMWHGGNPMI